MGRLNKKPKTKDREIYFFRPVIQEYDKLTNTLLNISEHNYAFAFKDIFEKISMLPNDINDKFSLYEIKSDGSYNFMIIDFINDSFIYGWLANAPNDVFPDLHQNNKIQNLSKFVSSSSKLLNYTHFVIALKENFVAVEYNHVGARYQSIVSYINAKCATDYRLSLLARINENGHKQLNKTKIIHGFSILIDNKDRNNNIIQNSEICDAYDKVASLTSSSLSDIPDDLCVEIRVKTRKGFSLRPALKDDFGLWADYLNDTLKDVKDKKYKRN